MNYSHRCPKGNRQMRRVLNQAANAAVKAKGTISPWSIAARAALGHAQAIGRSRTVVSIDLEDPARARALRRAGTSRQRGGQESPRTQDDPRIAGSRLSRRAHLTCSISVSDFRPWLIERPRKWPVIDRFAKVSRGESRECRSLCRLRRSAGPPTPTLPVVCPRQSALDFL